WQALGPSDWATLALLAGLVVGVSSGVAKAYQSGPPAIIATFDYAYLGFAAFWGFILFSDTPDLATVVGTLLIAGAARRLGRPPAAAARRRAAGQPASPAGTGGQPAPHRCICGVRRHGPGTAGPAARTERPLHDGEAAASVNPPAPQGHRTTICLRCPAPR